MSSLSKLKKGLKSAQGTPSALEAALGNIAQPPREQGDETTGAQLSHKRPPHPTIPKKISVKVTASHAARLAKRAAVAKNITPVSAVPTVPQNGASDMPDLVTQSEEQQALQLKVPMSVYNAFCEAAVKEFGYKKGNKTQMFMKLWQDYEA